jgi:hypothetical protein
MKRLSQNQETRFGDRKMLGTDKDCGSDENGRPLNTAKPKTAAPKSEHSPETERALRRFYPESELSQDKPTGGIYQKNYRR